MNSLFAISGLPFWCKCVVDVRSCIVVVTSWTRAQAIAEGGKGKSCSVSASGETKNNAIDKKAGRVGATKAARVDPKYGMESDMYYAVAVTGFPGDTTKSKP